MRSMIGRLLFGGIFLVTGVVAGAYVYVTQPFDPPVDSSSIGSVPSTVATLPGATLSPLPAVPTSESASSSCSTTTRPFVPTRITVSNVTSGATVLAEAPDGNGVSPSPPLSDTGKNQFAWDNASALPDSGKGNVLLTAHTWPDGSAMGNRLLKTLRAGDRFVLQGGAGQRLCYQVTEIVSVPVEDYPGNRVYDMTGSEQAIITVCSGLRRGPGDWAERTLWFAIPVK